MGPTQREKEWAVRASRFLKVEAKRAGVTYAQLADKLCRYGVTDETEASVSSKLGRGTFSVVFFLSCLTVLDIKTLRLEEM